jgi:tRNA(fMet)-specific endonuclease VapC
LIQLDSSFLVDLMREEQRGRGAASAFAEQLDQEELAVSIHVLCELQAGAALARDPVGERRRVRTACRGLRVVLPDDQFPYVYGSLLVGLRRRGERIDTMDLLIATAALHAGAPLVTANAKHFERVPGLRVLTY